MPPTEAEVQSWMERWSQEAVGVASPALESLLYFSDATRDAMPSSSLDPQHRAFLRAQLSRTDATVEMRLVDDTGRVRAHLTAKEVALGEKQHLSFQSEVGHLVTAGQVRRVGLEHIWSRW